MIASVSDVSGQGRRLVLEPNDSLSLQGNYGFLLSLLILSLLVSLAFVLAGAWLALPVVIVELIAVTVLCYQAKLQASFLEVVSIDDTQVVVEKGRNRAEQTWCFDRQKARVLIEDTGEPFENFRLSIVGDVGMLCLADGLDTQECNELKQLLSEAGLRVVSSSHWVLLEA